MDFTVWNVIPFTMKTKSCNFTQRFRHLEQAINDPVKLVWRNNFIVEILKHKSYYIQWSERGLKCIKYFHSDEYTLESSCGRVQWEVLHCTCITEFIYWRPREEEANSYNQVVNIWASHATYAIICHIHLCCIVFFLYV